MKDKDTKALEILMEELYQTKDYPKMKGISLLRLVNNELNSPRYHGIDYENDHTEESGHLEGMIMVKDILHEYDPDNKETGEVLQKILDILTKKVNAIADRMKVYGHKHIDKMSPRMIGRASAFNEVISWIKNPPAY